MLYVIVMMMVKQLTVMLGQLVIGITFFFVHLFILFGGDHTSCFQGLLLALSLGIISGSLGRTYEILALEPRLSVCKANFLPTGLIALVPSLFWLCLHTRL